MFAIFLRLKADGVTSDGVNAARPDVKHLHPIFRQRIDGVDKWVPVPKGGVGTVYPTLREAQEDWRTIKNNVFTKEDNVITIYNLIGDFSRECDLHGQAHEADIELHVLQSVMIDNDPVDLELF